VRQRRAFIAEDLCQFDVKVGNALPDLADRLPRGVPADKPVREPDAVFPVALWIDEALGRIEILAVDRVDEPSVDLGRRSGALIRHNRILSRGANHAPGARFSSRQPT
jgi:hypothetical protein